LASLPPVLPPYLPSIAIRHFGGLGFSAERTPPAIAWATAASAQTRSATDTIGLCPSTRLHCKCTKYLFPHARGVGRIGAVLTVARDPEIAYLPPRCYGVSERHTLGGPPCFRASLCADAPLYLVDSVWSKAPTSASVSGCNLSNSFCGTVRYFQVLEVNSVAFSHQSVAALALCFVSSVS
jgi:hypothetical protein